MVGKIVFAGFGGSCDSYNFTGWSIGMDTRDPKMKTIFNMISGPDSIPQNGTWQGGGVSSDQSIGP